MAHSVWANAVVVALVVGAAGLTGCGGGGSSGGISGAKVGTSGGGASGGATSGGSHGGTSGGVTRPGTTAGGTSGGSHGGAPAIGQTVPANQSTSAPTNGTVGITFSQAMDQATLTPAALAIADAQGTVVASQIFYDAQFFIATIAPNQALAASTPYTVTIDGAVAAASGVKLGQPVSFTFTTTQGPAQGPIAFGGVASVALAGTPVYTVAWQAAASPDYGANELFYTIHGGASAATIDYNTILATAPFGATQIQVSASPGSFFAVRAWDMAGNTDANGTAMAAGGTPSPTPTPTPPPTTTSIQTVWLILMENHDWSSISGSSSAPYINNTLLAQGAHAEDYHNPPGQHPSEPNYIWLEAGDNLGLTTDADPSHHNHSTTTQHLVSQLEAAGVSWRTYQEDMPVGGCPIHSNGSYACKHNPFVFFDDITGGISATDAYCASHHTAYTAAQLRTDLASSGVPRYNFVTPNICNDMHDVCSLGDSILQGDQWLSQVIPIIQASAAYQAGGAIFITWDESEGAGDPPIGMIVLSPMAKPGYSNTIHYDHSSMLKSAQEIFGVTPLLGHAADAGTADLADLFTHFP